jgi:hypothetical protein
MYDAVKCLLISSYTHFKVVYCVRFFISKYTDELHQLSAQLYLVVI